MKIVDIGLFRFKKKKIQFAMLQCLRGIGIVDWAAL